METLLSELQGYLFQQFVLPALFALDLAEYAETAFDAVENVLLGAVQVLIAIALFAPLERWRPVERWTNRREARVDVIYTLLQRLGFVPLFLFLGVAPLFQALEQELRLAGFTPLQPEALIPPLAAHPVADFALYLLILDFVAYWMHRLQHRVGAWWALHSLHHSQRQMTFWTDDRNHLLDDVLRYAWFTVVALAIGVPPGTFPWLLVVIALVESLSHANVRLSFGAIGDRLLVSPRYHRIHHAMGIGHDGPARGCNFATLFPVWDLLFRTACIAPVYPATGIRDQLEGRDYGEGFWRQQLLGFKRLAAALGWRRRALASEKVGRGRAPSGRLRVAVRAQPGDDPGAGRV
ncbi:MAG: fatty acid hydroxylase [Azospira oryzae]|nr:MAG: fatty acid hydroxylase [Azospira oryzae]PZP79081.1 MAG: fatty acid hydroxylase [Azospira oryzae]